MHLLGVFLFIPAFVCMVYFTISDFFPREYTVEKYMRIVVVDTKAFKTTVFGKDRIREVSRWEIYQKVLGKRILFKESELAKNLLTSPENAFRTKIEVFDAKKGG